MQVGHGGSGVPTSGGASPDAAAAAPHFPLPRPRQFAANPAWSPDGRVISFDSIRDSTGLGAVYRIDVDGTDERALTTNEANNAMPRWSPDGRRITWSRVADRQSSLMIAKADGSSAGKLADAGGGSFTPGGTRLAAVARGEDRNHWFVVVLRADGSGFRRVSLTER
jgi:TolB protein